MNNKEFILSFQQLSDSEKASVKIFYENLLKKSIFQDIRESAEEKLKLISSII